MQQRIFRRRSTGRYTFAAALLAAALVIFAWDESSAQTNAPESVAQEQATPSPVEPPVAAPVLREQAIAPGALPSPEALPPLALALRELLAASEAQPVPRDAAGRAHHEESKVIGEFYAARNYEPLWRVAGSWSAAASSAVNRLHKAGDDALDISALRLPVLSKGSDSALAAADLAASELVLSQAVVAYGKQAGGARIKPSSLSRLITASPEVAGVAAILSSVAAAGGNAGDHLHAFNPPHPGYRALRTKLAEIRSFKPAAKDPAAVIGQGPPLRIGMSDSRVPLIRARLELGAHETGADPLLYDMKTAGAVTEFQRSRGLRANGVLTPQTVNALSGDPAANASHIEGEIISNMERWRWLPRDLGQMHLMVNIPEFMVRVSKNGQRIHETRVITGATKTPSPIFSHRMQHLIVNPSWHVPPSIIKESGGAEIMGTKGFEVRQTRYGVAVRQPPGPKNALGYIKFMFPNDHAVYLHDTPGRHLFSASMRAMSHGCIRVHEPFKLAEIVMSTAPGWSESRLRSMIGSGERTIPLPEHLPIHIAYFTTFVDDNGQLQQRPDIYGHSRRVMDALNVKPRGPQISLR